MKKLVFGFIGMIMLCMAASCGSKSNSECNNECCADTVEAVLDTLPMDTVVEIADTMLVD